MAGAEPGPDPRILAYLPRRTPAVGQPGDRSERWSGRPLVGIHDEGVGARSRSTQLRRGGDRGRSRAQKFGA